MISSIRSLFDSWLGRIIAIGFVILVGIAFALSDVSGNLGGGVSGSTVAKVGGEAISSSDLRLAIENQHRQVRSQNPNVDMGSFIRQGGGDQVLEQLVNSFVIAAFAEKNGFGASKRMVDAEIAKIPGMVDSEGNLNKEAFQRFLGAQNLTEEFLRDDIKRSFFTDQLLPTTEMGLNMPKSLTMRYASVNYETRSGRIAAVPSNAFAPKTPPSEAVLTEYYKKNADKFMVPERRSIRYALFTREVVGDAGKPTDAEISEYYAANVDAYSASKVVTFEQIIVPTEAVAKAAQARVSKGESVAAVAGDLGFTVSNDTVASETAMTAKSSAKVAKAVFATAQGQVAVPAESDFGWHVIRVSKVENRPSRSLAEARNEIYTTLEADKSEQAFSDITTEMQDRLEDGDSLTVVAKEYGLTVQSTPKLLPMGLNPDDPSYKPRAELGAILPAAFQLGADDAGNLVEVEQGKTFALVGVAEIDEAAPAPLAKIKPNVAQSWALTEGDKAAKAAADKIVAGVKGGKSLEDAVASITAQLPAIETLNGSRQQLAEAGPNVPPALFTMFQMPIRGVRASAIGQDRGYFVIYVDRIEPAKLEQDDPRLADFNRQYQGAVGQELQRQMVAAMRADVGVEINDSAVADIKKQLTGDS